MSELSRPVLFVTLKTSQIGTAMTIAKTDETPHRYSEGRSHLADDTGVVGRLVGCVNRAEPALTAQRRSALQIPQCGWS
jgi:hypothetical protein